MSKAKVEIIYQDDGIIVINKPAGVSVTKDRSGKEQLTDILAGQIDKQLCSQLRLIHRLDKDTSGVMILAKNIEAQKRFTSYFEKREIKKTYLALVSGIVRGREGTIDAPLLPDPKEPQLMRITGKKGKEAVTDWRLLADFDLLSLLAVTPLTGRTHQIRVHLASIGLPVAIDPLYGSSRPILLSDFKSDYRLGIGQLERPLIERLTLHAYQIELPVPLCHSDRPFCHSERSEESVIPAKAGIQSSVFIAKLDKKFTATLKMLTKYNRLGPAAFINPDDFSKILNGDAL